jgi:hypothetical protein
MKKSELKQLIKEEIYNILNENTEKYSVKSSKKGFSVVKNSTGAEITSFDTEEKAKQHAEKLNKMKFVPKEKFNEIVSPKSLSQISDEIEELEIIKRKYEKKGDLDKAAQTEDKIENLKSMFKQALQK